MQGKDGDLDDQDFEGNVDYDMTRKASRAILLKNPMKKSPVY